MWFVPKTAEGVGAMAAVQPQENFLIFYHRLRLETVFPGFKLPQNCCISTKIDSHSPSHIPCLKDFPHNLTIHESKKTSKILISELFSESKKI